MDRSLQLKFDQTVLGFLSRLIGQYAFKTEDITLGNYEIRFESHQSVAHPEQPLKLQRVVLLHNHEACLSFRVTELNDESKAIQFEIEKSYAFDFVSFCILFKFFYQHVKNKMGYETLYVKTERFRCYMFKKIFGFQLVHYVKGSYTMKFDAIESFQHIWDEFYGTKIEENLYNFLLPVDAGGYVPGNVFARNNTQDVSHQPYRITEKKLLDVESPIAEIKIGYNLYSITLNDLSETGLSFTLLPVDDDPHNELPQPEVIQNHCYSVRIRDQKLKIDWTHLIVQVQWAKGNVFGCKIVEHQDNWTKTISNLNIKEYERLTFNLRSS